jgi:osmoprotectant transport system permease protein
MSGQTAAKLVQAWENLPDYLGQHIQISLVSLILGIAISLPLAIWAGRSRLLRWYALTAASIIQTIPSIALLALFYPLLLGVAYVTGEVLGWFSFSALGFLPSVIALTLYSVLPILRNTVTGIAGLDGRVLEAARGIGMTPRQVLFEVELPLAAPVILAGIRTATVWVVGTATLSTPVGQTSLGNYIFTGLQTENWISVLFGCAAAAGLAIVLDQLIGLLERAVALRSRARALAAGLGLLAVLLGGIAPRLVVPETTTRVVGAKTFSEQFILAELMERLLARAGYEAATREGLGSTIIFNALAQGEIDCYVDYSGTIWANHMERQDTPDARTVLNEMAAWLEREHGIRYVGALGFENAYGLAMRRDRAEELGVHSIADLGVRARELKIGGDYEFFARPEWERIREIYGLEFGERKQYQSTFMYRAVAGGDVDVISAFTTDGRIAAFDLVVLDDPRDAIPPYDAVLLASPRAVLDPGFLAALEPLVGAIDLPLMREANRRVDLEGDTPEQAARRLWERLALPPLF